MKITVTFTDSTDIGIPDGSTLTFEDVDCCQVNTPVDIRETSCGDAGCEGCSATHRRPTGTARLILEAEGRAKGLRWAIPEAAS